MSKRTGGNPRILRSHRLSTALSFRANPRPLPSGQVVTAEDDIAL
ncbi:MAG: hypothetical protein WBO46_08120 [Caldilineaceae bacterium]